MQGMMSRRLSGGSTITQYECVHCMCHGCSDKGNRQSCRRCAGRRNFPIGTRGELPICRRARCRRCAAEVMYLPRPKPCVEISRAWLSPEIAVLRDRRGNCRRVRGINAKTGKAEFDELIGSEMPNRRTNQFNQEFSPFGRAKIEGKSLLINNFLYRISAHHY